MKTYFFAFIQNNNGAYYTSGTLKIPKNLSGDDLYKEAIKKLTNEFKTDKFCLISFNQI